MAQKHRLKAETSIRNAKENDLSHVVIETEDLVQILAEFYRVRNRMVKAEMKLKKRK